MKNSVAPAVGIEPTWTIVFDNTCPVVRKLGWLVRQWDRAGTFCFVGRDSQDAEHTSYIARLDETPWSLLLIDRTGQTWSGPEALPFILKNLPSGKIAAVTYTVPGTMWLTRQLYYMVSRNRRAFSRHSQAAALLHNRPAS